MKPDLLRSASLMLLTWPLLFAVEAQSADADEQASTWPLCTTTGARILPLISRNPTPAAVYLEADNGTISKTGTSILSGNVNIQQDQNLINAGQASYDRPNNTVKASGKVRLQTPELIINSSDLKFQLDAQTATVNQSAYILRDGSGNGSSAQLIQQGKQQTTLKTATFSTCPPNQRSWHIKANEITLNHKTQIGAARDVSIRFGDTPILYTPYFNFPMNNQRKSGFLAPKLGITDQSGTRISLPYYFNLASNYDLTLTPNLLTQRGLKLDAEFRYLLPDHEGSLRLDYLPNDNNYNDQNRVLTSIQHRSRLAANTRLEINATDVSDKDYFDDLGDSLLASSTAALERSITLSRHQDNWTFSGSLQDYQILDSSSSPPYSRLPELSLSYEPKKGFYNTQNRFEAELVNFHQENATTGVRLDINGLVSKRFGDASWYVEPSVQLRHTLYSLDDNTLTNNNSPSRTLPTASIDAGLFLERPIRDKDKTQTLEPRLLYTWTPYEDQSDIPVFDAADTSFGTSTRLFSTNRFTGKDRIGDTNQLTAAVTSRIIDTRVGEETLALSVGQIFYFEERMVTLPGFTAETGNRSEIALEFSGRFSDRTRLISSTYWDPDDNQVSLSETRLHYKDPQNRIVNLVYRNLDEELEQAQLSFATPLSEKWALIGNYEKDLQNDRDLETLGGVEYRSCCWKTRLIARRYLTSDNTTYDNGFFIEFELKGLGNIGTGAKNLLEQQIYGYDD